tara:strand:+ start:362 stop:964 length:603 start_codon:yes stop_codon:yes gene_type:complete
MHAQTCIPKNQLGAALATALFFMVVITLLGLAAMRSGRTDMRLALNEESRVQSLQSAESLLEDLLQSRENLVVYPGSGYVQNCFLTDNLDATVLENKQNFVCPTDTADASVLSDGPLKKYAYTLIRRESISGSDFAPVSALRRGDSGVRYQLANFTVVAGYDRTITSRASGAEEEGNFGAAEVSQGTYVKVDSVDGLVTE